MNVHGSAYFMEGLQNVTYNDFIASDSVIGNFVMSVALCMTEYASVFIM
jgi:hypothetical protein